jgi:hypothetical protein
MKSHDVKVSYKEIKGGNHFTSISRNATMIAGVFDQFDQWKRTK